MAITPVAFFAYNRPSHADRALEALARCEVGNQFEFHFFADGARSPADDGQVESTRECLRRWAPHFGARLVERTENAGLARSIGVAIRKQASADYVVMAKDGYSTYSNAATSAMASVPGVEKSAALRSDTLLAFGKQASITGFDPNRTIVPLSFSICPAFPTLTLVTSTSACFGGFR